MATGIEVTARQEAYGVIYSLLADTLHHDYADDRSPLADELRKLADEFRSKSGDAPKSTVPDTLGRLIDAADAMNSTRLRNIVVDTLDALGPAWHTFARGTSFGGQAIAPGDRVLLTNVGRKLKAFRPGYVPSWVSKRTEWDESTAVVLPPAVLGRVRRHFDNPKEDPPPKAYDRPPGPSRWNPENKDSHWREY